MKQCRNCGKELRDDARFCTSCGTSVSQEPQQPAYEKQETVRQPVYQEQYSAPQQEKRSKKSAAPWIALIIGLLVVLIALVGVAVVLIFGNPFAKEETVVVNTESTEEETEEVSTEEQATEEVTEEETMAVDESAYEEELNNVKRYNAFDDILSMFYSAEQLPDESSIDSSMGDLRDNKFAMADVDQDGKEELLIQVTEACMAGMMVKIYDVDESKYGQNDAYSCELTEFPSITVYDNGVITADWSHNQGIGDKLWPYTLYTYDASTNSYERRGSVDSWDKELTDTDYSGNQFPDDIDEDGDGTIYYVTDTDQGDEQTIMDGDAYEEWRNHFLDGASEVTINWQKYEDADITQYARNYIDTYFRYHDETQPQDTGTDIGRMFLQNEDYDEVTDIMKDAGVEMEENGDDDEVYSMNGYDGDDQVFMVSYMDIGSFKYMEKQVGDVTVLGIYPGIDLKEAEEKLISYGFYNSFDQMYITGEGFGNIGIYLDSANDKVIGISMRGYCGYAG